MSRVARIKAKLPWTSLYHMRDEADFKIIRTSISKPRSLAIPDKVLDACDL